VSIGADLLDASLVPMPEVRAECAPAREPGARVYVPLWEAGLRVGAARYAVVGAAVVGRWRTVITPGSGTKATLLEEAEVGMLRRTWKATRIAESERADQRERRGGAGIATHGIETD